MPDQFHHFERGNADANSSTDGGVQGIAEAIGPVSNAACFSKQAGQIHSPPPIQHRTATRNFESVVIRSCQPALRSNSDQNQHAIHT